VIRKDGTRCNGIAVKNFDRCFHHGGSGVLARRGLYRKKLRYLAWSEPRAQLKSEAQLRDEAKTKLAILSEFPVGKEILSEFPVGKEILSEFPVGKDM
jgi:hypothetical protein